MNSISRENPADFFDETRDVDDEDEAGEELFFCVLHCGDNSLDSLKAWVTDDAIPCKIAAEETEVGEEPLFMFEWGENSFGSLNECCGTGRTVLGLFLNRRGIVA